MSHYSSRFNKVKFGMFQMTLNARAPHLWQLPLLTLALVLSGIVTAQPAPNALPTGGQVTAGQARINNTGANMVVQQSSDKAAINWQTFNLGKDAKLEFKQPNANSVTLNRVLGTDPSQILVASQPMVKLY
jgi:large exoprotein involved in heme utilization and adhesion